MNNRKWRLFLESQAVEIDKRELEQQKRAHSSASELKELAYRADICLQGSGSF